MAINGTFQQSLLSNGLVDSDKNINLKKKKKISFLMLKLHPAVVAILDFWPTK
jgi:hypothetical protein